jgi:hypothetical protein
MDSLKPSELFNMKESYSIAAISKIFFKWFFFESTTR